MEVYRWPFFSYWHESNFTDMFVTMLFPHRARIRVTIKCFDKSHYQSSELPDVDVVRPCIFREFDPTRRSSKPRLNICLNGICQLHIVTGDATVEICPSGGFKCSWRIAEVRGPERTRLPSVDSSLDFQVERLDL